MLCIFFLAKCTKMIYNNQPKEGVNMSRKPKYFMPDHYKQWTTTERESFIMSFYPKVEEIVESLGVPEKYYPDLISAGMLGVVETIENFIQDPEDHYYLSQAIHNSIAISILQCYLTLATAFSIKVTRLGLQRTRDLIAGEHLEEIMHQLEVPPKYYNNFVMALNSYDSYQDSPSSENIEESAINNVSITEIETTILELYAAGIMSEQELIIFINYYIS